MNTDETTDIFSLSQKNVDTFFNEIERVSPKFNQSLLKLYQDYVDAWKAVINSAISLEKEYATKAGLSVNVPESVLKTIRDITEISIQAYLQQNKLALDTSEASKQALVTFNQNTKSFDSLNREIMGYLMSLFERKQVVDSSNHKN